MCRLFSKIDRFDTILDCPNCNREPKVENCFTNSTLSSKFKIYCPYCELSTKMHRTLNGSKREWDKVVKDYVKRL